MLLIIAKRTNGFSLIELLIGILLGTILIAGASSIYLASKRSYLETEQVAALSENSRFAVQLLNDSLRHVGFMGASPAFSIQADVNLSAITSDCTEQAKAYDLNNYLFAATTDPNDPKIFNCIDDAKPNTDVLVVKYVVPRPYTDADPNDPNAPTNGVIDFPEALDSKTTYVMANTQSGRIFDGADSPPTIIKGGEIPDGVTWKYQMAIYYIRNTPIPRLSRKVLNWSGSAMEITTEDLVEGVENIRFLFGYDSVASSDGEVDTYSNAGNVTDWSRVLSIEAFILLRSATEDMQYTDAKTYKLGDLTVIPDPDDRNYRRLVAHSSISLRNPQFLIRGGA